MTEETKAPEPKWYSSGRGIFCRDAGFQLATTPIVPSWQEDTARFIDLLNKGEEHDALAAQLAKVTADRDRPDFDGRKVRRAPRPDFAERVRALIPMAKDAAKGDTRGSLVFALEALEADLRAHFAPRGKR